LLIVGVLIVHAVIDQPSQWITQPYRLLDQSHIKALIKSTDNPIKSNPRLVVQPQIHYAISCYDAMKTRHIFRVCPDFLAWSRTCLLEKVHDKERKSNKSEMERIMG